MSKDFPCGRFSTAFTTIPAGDVQVTGLPAGAAGSPRLAPSELTSLAASFAVSPDMADLLPEAAERAGVMARRFVPARPASGSEDYLPAFGD
jgi:hypothetical protein